MDGERSSSLNLRVTDPMFDQLFKWSRQWGVTLPQAARIKLTAEHWTSEELQTAIHNGMVEREADTILRASGRAASVQQALDTVKRLYEESERLYKEAKRRNE